MGPGGSFYSALVGAVLIGGVQARRRWELVTWPVPFRDPLARPGRSAMPCYLVTSSPAVLLAALGSAGLCPLGNPGACHPIPILPRYDFIVSSPHQPPPPSAGHGSLPPRPNAVGMPPPQGSTAASSLAQRFQQYGYWHAKFQFQAIKQYN